MADGLRRGRLEYLAGTGALVLAGVLAVFEAWPFGDERKPRPDAPLWDVLVYDGAVLGFLKLALVMLALYGIASVPALIAGGRWAKGLGTSGLVADDAATESTVALVRADATVQALEERLLQLENDYADLVATVDGGSRGGIIDP